MRKAWMVVLTLAAMGLSGCGGSREVEEVVKRPNIILIMTDDQGWAQLGMRGDPDLETPNLDKLAAESVELERFYVTPVCAPTRAGLMTGRYHYRTGVTDTYLGRAMMAGDETTIAEMLRTGGYRTGIFGKWHLGDNYPMRAIDQGFDEAIVHRGGGIKQPSDPPGSDYFDPILFHNGEQKQYKGYCTDVFFDEAMRFIEASGDAPFFAYIPTNAPHSPYLVPDEYRERYEAKGLDDKDARIYGMITNIDDNVGRLLAYLDEKGLAQDTLVVFLTDNGPTTQRFTAGLRDQKASVYEGGIRAPFFIRWPGVLAPRKIDRIAAYIDVTPTLLSAAQVSPPNLVRFDGVDLMPLLNGRVEPEQWRPNRLIYIQAHRGDQPIRDRNMAVISQQFKLLQPKFFAEAMPRKVTYDLYDLEADPGEQEPLPVAFNLPTLKRLREGYAGWLTDVSNTRGYDPQRIQLGNPAENPQTLTRQDWRIGGQDSWGRGRAGVWMVDVREPGTYDVTLDFDPLGTSGRVEFKLGPVMGQQDVTADQTSAAFENLEFPRTVGQIEARVVTGTGEVEGVRFVHLDRKDLPPPSDEAPAFANEP